MSGVTVVTPASADPIEDNEIKMFTRSPITTYSMWIKRHIGIYGFHRSMIAKIDRRKMIETTNEIVESLEQLRWVDNDIQFSYALTTGLYKGVDTEKGSTQATSLDY